MKKKQFLILSFFYLAFSALILNSCGNREETISCFPNTIIDVQLNLNLPKYYNLQTESNWLYIDEQSSGTRGLIVVRSSTGFKIYDRNAPHICPDKQSTLSVVDNIKISCPKDGSEWILLTGQPTKIAKVSPKTYPYNYDPSTKILHIYN